MCACAVFPMNDAWTPRARIVCGARAHRLLHERRHCLWGAVYCTSADIVCGASMNDEWTPRARGLLTHAASRHPLAPSTQNEPHPSTSRLSSPPALPAWRDPLPPCAPHAPPPPVTARPHSPDFATGADRWLPERSPRPRLRGVPVLPLAFLSLQRGGVCEAHRIIYYILYYIYIYIIIYIIYIYIYI